MKPSDYKKLETDKKFKKQYLKKTLWWKSFLFFAPACLIFIGLAGILHMSHSDKLWTLYALPYVVVFALGTIWLKGLKNHIQGKMLSDKERYLACAAKSIGNKDGRYFFIFSKDSKRHNEELIKKLSEEITIDSLSAEQLDFAKNEMLELSTSQEETQIYLKAIKVDAVLKSNRETVASGITPLLYISRKDIFVIKYKDLK